MLPLLLPVLGVAVLIRGIETFKIFDPVYMLTRGQPGGATETISMYMYNGAFVYFRMGYIAAAALIVLILVVCDLPRRCQVGPADMAERGSRRAGRLAGSRS